MLTELPERNYSRDFQNQDDAVQEACLAFYALSDVTFCHSLINLHQAKKPVRVVIDRQWIRSCPIAIECAKL
ncbi:hypothetical protein JG687_00018412 [Phytophthora cactorum]|uniref:Uncharacterized protein n=1 Tax=Phytophthora cactorum TaxID=29920 RepID=A0A8T1TNY8_9STRA|nr:hypothetical protein JG687_00018412 [Phytophthora cactorum]